MELFLAPTVYNFGPNAFPHNAVDPSEHVNGLEEASDTIRDLAVSAAAFVKENQIPTKLFTIISLFMSLIAVLERKYALKSLLNAIIMWIVSFWVWLVSTAVIGMLHGVIAYNRLSTVNVVVGNKTFTIDWQNIKVEGDSELVRLLRTRDRLEIPRSAEYFGLIAKYLQGSRTDSGSDCMRDITDKNKLLNLLEEARYYRLDKLEQLLLGQALD